MGELALEVQALTSGNVELVYVDQRYTGDEPAMAAAEQGADVGLGDPDTAFQWLVA